MPDEKLKNVASHFAFGRNWASYADLIGASEIAEAQKGLLRLIPAADIAGRSFLDIGCGSGLHALAAAQLGVVRILAIDIDPESVTTARALLSAHATAAPWQVETMSVFDLDVQKLGTFDIVYSWGVLHHTGSMWEAVGKAANMVATNGILALALYRRTSTDAFWKAEKRLYARAPEHVQRAVRAAYVTAFRLGKLATGRSFRDHVQSYNARGMDFYHDVHDWLGGYPYETALAEEVEALLQPLGFTAERVFARGKTLGLFGSGCDEYVYRRKRDAPRA